MFRAGEGYERTRIDIPPTELEEVEIRLSFLVVNVLAEDFLVGARLVRLEDNVGALGAILEDVLLDLDSVAFDRAEVPVEGLQFRFALVASDVDERDNARHDSQSGNAGIDDSVLHQRTDVPTHRLSPS